MSDYLQKAKALKKLGLVNFAIPRKGKEHHLTPAQKGQITKLANKNKSLLAHPQDYVSKSVSRKTAAALDTAALKVSTGKRVRVLIPVEKGETVKVMKNGIIRKTNGPFVKTIYPAGWNMLDAADKLFNRKLKRNEYVMVQIGKNAPFFRTFTNKQQLLNYLQAWQPKDKNKTKEELIEHFALVRINDPRYMTDDDDDEDEDEFEFFETVRQDHNRERVASVKKKKGGKNSRY